MKKRNSPLTKLRLLSFFSIFFFIFITLATLFFIENQSISNSKTLDFFKKDGQIEKIDFSSFPVVGRITTLNWERENVFINDNIYLFQGGGYEIKDLNIINSKENPNPVRILIFGDSHTWGNGNIDKYSTITQMIQQKLDQVAGKNVFTVKVLASNGASTYRHYDYFALNSVESFKPDLIIYNYFNNDIDPSFNESLICRSTPIATCPQSKSALLDPSYQSCIHGSGDVLSKILGVMKFKFPNTIKKLLDQHCQPLLLKAEKRTYNPQQSVKDPLNSPYYPIWVKSMALLYTTLRSQSSAPIAFADLKDFSIPKVIEDKMVSVAGKSGFNIIPMPETEKLMYNPPKIPADTNPGAYLSSIAFINPGNSHTASHINHLYSSDIVNYILKTIPEERVRQSQATRISSLDKTPLIAYTMPYFDTKVESISDSESNFSFSKSYDNLYIQRTSSVEKLPFQYVNCANLGKPNLIITLNKNIKSGSLILSKLPTSPQIEIGSYTYDSNLKLVYTPLGAYTAENQRVELPPSALSTSLVLSFPNPNLQNCEYNKEIDVPDFNLNIKYQKN